MKICTVLIGPIADAVGVIHANGTTIEIEDAVAARFQSWRFVKIIGTVIVSVNPE